MHYYSVGQSWIRGPETEGKKTNGRLWTHPGEITRDEASLVSRMGTENGVQCRGAGRYVDSGTREPGSKPGSDICHL